MLALEFQIQSNPFAMYNQIFFTNVLRLLDEQGLTKYEFAERSGVSISFLSDLTNAKANPSLKIMEAIANALDTPLTVLLESTDLDAEALDQLAGGKAPRSLPEGMVRIAGVLTSEQAERVRRWDEANRKRLRQISEKQSATPGKSVS